MLHYYTLRIKYLIFVIIVAWYKIVMIKSSIFIIIFTAIILGIVKRNPLFFHSISCKNNEFVFTTPNITDKTILFKVSKKISKIYLKI